MRVRHYLWAGLLAWCAGNLPTPTVAQTVTQTVTQTEAPPVTTTVARIAAPESQFIGVPFVSNTVVTHRPEVGFPLDHILRKGAGTVVVAVLVGEDGVPVRHRIVSAEPPLIFNRYVEAALPDFRFGIASRDGKPLAYETRLTLNFAPKP